MSLGTPPRWYILKYLEAPQVLALLSKAIEHEKPEVREYLKEVEIVITSARQGLSCDLFVPEASQETGRARKFARPLFDKLKQEYTNLSGRQPEETVTKPDEARGLQKLLPRLLLDGREHAPDQRAELASGEFLIIASDETSAATAAETLRRLTHHTTNARWSSAGGVDKKERYLFLVRDDSARGSNLESIWTGLAEAGFQKLRTFKTDNLRVHLPEQMDGLVIHPDRQTLKAFCALLQACPALYTSDQTRWDAIMQLQQGSLLAIGEVGRIEAQTILNVYFLAALNFSNEFRLDSRINDESKIEIRSHDLSASQAAMENLIEELKSAEGYQGYRLKIRKTNQVWRGHVEEQDLEELRDYYDRRLMLLRAARQPKPILLRFRQSELGAMSQVLRHTPLKYLQDGRIQYGFFAPARPGTTTTPEGFEFPEFGMHYLLFKEGWADLDGQDPLLDWSSAAPMKFWLDPFWARYHSPAEGVNSLVFVPDGCALFPTMHGWEASEMDEYLRKTLADFLPDRLKKSEPASGAIYIFEPNPNSADIKITLLDESQFKPFSERLSWMNTHISLNEELLLDQGRLMRRLEPVADASAVLRLMSGHAKTMKRHLLEEVALAVSAVEANLVERLKDLDAAIEVYKKNTTLLLTEAGKFNAQYEKLREYLGSIRTQAAETETTIKNQTADAKRVATEYGQAIARIDVELRSMEEQRQEIEAKVTAELDQVRETRARLIRELNKLNQPR